MRVSAIAAGSEAAGLVTENGNTVGEVTVGGTVALIVFGGGLGGLLASIVVVGAEPWLRWMGPLRGLGFGLAVLAAYAYHEPFESFDFLLLDPPALNVAMFGGLFIGFGFAVSGVYWLLDRRLPPAGDDIQIGYLVLASFGMMPLFMAALFFTTPSFCACEPAHLIGLTILVMVASTVITLAASASAAVPRWLSRTVTLTGYGALAVLLVTGLSRTLDEIRVIL